MRKCYTLALWCLLVGALPALSAPQLPAATKLGANQRPKYENALRRYLNSGRHETATMLERLAKLSPTLEQALERKQLPNWLKYITLAESRLDHTAVSSAGAAGLWQLMPTTARSLGLQVDERADERFDPGQSSEAAAALLADLHQQFDDWLLVLAAYNCGPTRLRRILRQTDEHDYAAIAHRLPTQTQRYIPRVLAIATIAEHPTCFGFGEEKRKRRIEPSRCPHPYRIHFALPDPLASLPWRSADDSLLLVHASLSNEAASSTLVAPRVQLRKRERLLTLLADHAGDPELSYGNRKNAPQFAPRS